MNGRLQDVEHAAARALADARTLSDAYPLILEGICTALEWQVGAFWIVDRSSGERLQSAHVWRREDAELAAFEDACRHRTFQIGQGLPGRVWSSGAPVWLRDVVHDDNFPRAEAAANAGLHGAFGFPIFVGGEFYGVMEFFSGQILEPDAELIGILNRIGAQIGHFVEREEMGRRLVFHAALLESQGEAAIDGILVVSTENQILNWNRRFLEIWDIPESLVQAGDPHPIIEHKARMAANPDWFRTISFSAFEDPEATQRAEIPLADGRVIDRWTAPVKGPEGTLFGRVLYYRDVTSQKRTEQRLRDNERWYGFLAEVGKVMSQTLDYRANLNRLAHMAVPILGDWCIVHVVGEADELRTVAIAHADSHQVAMALRMQERYPVDPVLDVGLVDAIRIGSSQLLDEVSDDLLALAARDPQHLEQLRSFGFRSAMVVPLVCRERSLGAITFITAESARRYAKEDLQRAEDLAARVAFHVDNARLYEERALVALTLQESLLPPELPHIQGVELAARYHAAADSADVGGDFYDVFPAGQRSWGLALGDVSGKGVEAAAVTSLARHTLRTATMATQRPSEILSMLNAALLDQTEPDAFCTAVYALVEPRFGRVNVTASCGGHPVPYVVRSNGSLETLACEGTLLGVVADPELTDVSCELDFGDKLIVYTDGILDVPLEREFGTKQLEELFAACAKRGVKAAADLIERAVLELQDGRTRDDFAIVVLGVRASIFRRVRTPSLWRRLRESPGDLELPA